MSSCKSLMVRTKKDRLGLDQTVFDGSDFYGFNRKLQWWSACETRSQSSLIVFSTSTNCARWERSLGRFHTCTYQSMTCSLNTKTKKEQQNTSSIQERCNKSTPPTIINPTSALGGQTNGRKNIEMYGQRNRSPTDGVYPPHSRLLLSCRR